MRHKPASAASRASSPARSRRATRSSSTGATWIARSPIGRPSSWTIPAQFACARGEASLSTLEVPTLQDCQLRFAVRSTAIAVAGRIEAELDELLGPEGAAQLRKGLTALVQHAGDAPPPLVAALAPLLLPSQPAEDTEPTGRGAAQK